MMTPVKGNKEQRQDPRASFKQAKQIKNRDKTTNELFSKQVSRVRQPFELLFNWLIPKKKIKEQVIQVCKRNVDPYLWQNRFCFYKLNIFNP